MTAGHPRDRGKADGQKHVVFGISKAEPAAHPGAGGRGLHPELDKQGLQPTRIHLDFLRSIGVCSVR